jgi:flagellar biosynthetic protein FlhB
MSEQPAGEKSFDPTPKRKKDAAKKGDVLRSKELATAVATITGAAWLMAGGPWLLGNVQEIARSAFRFDRGEFENFAPGVMFTTALEALLPPILFLGVTVIAMTSIAQLLSDDGRFVPSNIKPKGSRINPLSGLKRMFGKQGMIELFKGVLKLILLAGIALYWARANAPLILGLGKGTLEGQLTAAWEAAIVLIGLLCLGLVVIAMIDWPIQLMQRMGRLKMTHQEVRDETKQAEGSPEMRAARKQRQRDMARGGVAKAMQEAQFLLTNPSHFSVALTYDPQLAAAPVVLAKGRDAQALAMRDLARENDVPVLEYPALARSVYFTTRTDQMIREELYVAIAALVSFVFSLKRGEHPVPPKVDVPLELRFDAQGKLIAA